jgi:hypothetical protein
MRTIPRNLPNDYPRGDRRARCDYCGVMWMRSQLVKKEDGLLACPDDAPGRVATELSRLNAQDAPQGKRDVSHFADGASDTRDLPVIHRTSAADILRVTS